MRLPIIKGLPLKLAGLAAGVVTAAGIGFLAVAWNANAARVSANEPVVRPARVMEITYRTHARSLVLAGTVVPRIESPLGFRVAGKIVQRAVDVGTVVQPGQLIAVLDPTDYRLAVDNPRAALPSANAAYTRANADHPRTIHRHA